MAPRTRSLISLVLAAVVAASADAQDPYAAETSVSAAATAGDAVAAPDAAAAAAAAGASVANDDEDDDEEDEDDEADVLVQGDAEGSDSADSSPCGCKGRVASPGDEYPFDIKCRCDIEKPDYGRLPSLTVGGRTELNGAAYLGYAPFASNLGKPMQSGFYQAKGNKPGRVPDKSHPWTHLINVRHSNKASNHQLQIGASYKVNDRLFFRKIANTLKADNPEWHEVATRTSSNTFQGQQTVQVNPVATNGNTVGIELYADDKNPPSTRTQHPSIRFHHAYRFWHRLEGRRSGLHAKVGKADSDNYSPIYSSHFRSVSDAKAKANIRTMEDALGSLAKLSGYTYDLVSHDYETPSHTPSRGVLAQELMTIMPEAVHHEEETGQHFVDYNALVATTVQGVKELLLKTEQERDAAAERAGRLEAELRSLSARVAALEKN
mmetsp:Transcript_3247/g.7052  ORF Transcript_3247/g.7052 Transcript_3247/m.7052 type:complete len:436 (-) Transcript_3247:123-1430(-)